MLRTATYCTTVPWRIPYLKVVACILLLSRLQEGNGTTTNFLRRPEEIQEERFQGENLPQSSIRVKLPALFPHCFRLRLGFVSLQAVQWELQGNP